MPPVVDQLVPIVKRIAQEELLPLFACCTHQYKDDGSILTEADMACHHRLKNELEERWPNIGYLSEECSREEQVALLSRYKDALWVVDPLDGSNNFACGIPYFCLSIALVNQHGVQMAVIYDPTRDECFSAQRQEGAWLNEQRILPQKGAPALDQSLLLANLDRLPSNLKKNLASSPPYGSVRNFGASALDWCWLADARGHLSLHAGQNFWDYAAGLLIFSESGGSSCSFDQQEIFQFGLEPRSVIAAKTEEHFLEWRDIVTSQLD